MMFDLWLVFRVNSTIIFFTVFYIKIVLNSGPLVGGIAGDMDNLLGRRGTFAARRNAVPNRP